MRHFCCSIILLFVYCSLNANTNTSQDSLCNIIKKSKDLREKYVAHLNLGDIHFEKPAQNTHLKAAYKLAKQAGDRKPALDILMELFGCYLKTEQEDSVNYYMNIIQNETEPEEANEYLSFLRMRLFDKEIMKGKEASEAVMKKELEIFKRADKNDVYIRIEQAYITGNSLYENNKHKEAALYLETAYNLSKTLRSDERYNYILITGWVYASVLDLLGKPTENVIQLEEVLHCYKEKFDRYFAKTRPFYPIYLYNLQCYASLIERIAVLPKEKMVYYINEIKQITPKVTAMIDKYSCCYAMRSYCIYAHDYKGAVSYTDSMIDYAKVLGPTLLPELYKARSSFYALLKDYENALKSHQLYVETKDSLSSQEATEQLSKLQVQYDLNKLSYEKTLLESENRRTLLIILVFVLFFVFTTCIYLYYSLKKERRMKKRLRELNVKAEESEKLKTAFLNSMCHEIRTPLNSIVGFSGIIIDESIDYDSKREFYVHITENTNKLTALIERLLVVANLDSSEELFPCESTSIQEICQCEFDKAQQEGKSTIVYTMDFPNEEVYVVTNSGYLSLIIENLLNNANKFTERGEVQLTVSMDQHRKNVEIAVTDTGCGIPIEKQDEVFQRFAQLDTFTQGNGLGLYICRVIVKRLSGNIGIDSSYTNGSRFVISLPLG